MRNKNYFKLNKTVNFYQRDASLNFFFESLSVIDKKITSSKELKKKFINIIPDGITNKELKFMELNRSNTKYIIYLSEYYNPEYDLLIYTKKGKKNFKYIYKIFYFFCSIFNFFISLNTLNKINSIKKIKYMNYFFQIFKIYLMSHLYKIINFANLDNRTRNLKKALKISEFVIGDYAVLSNLLIKKSKIKTLKLPIKFEFNLCHKPNKQFLSIFGSINSYRRLKIKTLIKNNLKHKEYLYNLWKVIEKNLIFNDVYKSKKSFKYHLVIPKSENEFFPSNMRYFHSLLNGAIPITCQKFKLGNFYPKLSLYINFNKKNTLGDLLKNYNSHKKRVMHNVELYNKINKKYFNRFVSEINKL